MIRGKAKEAKEVRWISAVETFSGMVMAMRRITGVQAVTVVEVGVPQVAVAAKAPEGIGGAIADEPKVVDSVLFETEETVVKQGTLR